jgi:hypothetical protein
LNATTTELANLEYLCTGLHRDQYTLLAKVRLRACPEHGMGTGLITVASAIF